MYFICNYLLKDSSYKCINIPKMKKTLFNLSVILVILPVSFGSSGKMSCNNSKCKSDKKSEVKHQDNEDKDKGSNSKQIKENTFRMNCMEIV